MPGRHSSRDMREDQIVPPEERDEAVRSREIDARCLFVGSVFLNLIADIGLHPESPPTTITIMGARQRHESN